MISIIFLFCFIVVITAQCADGTTEKLIPTTGERAEWQLDLSNVVQNAFIRVHMLPLDTGDVMKVVVDFDGPSDLKVAINSGESKRTIKVDATSDEASHPNSPSAPLVPSAPGATTSQNQNGDTTTTTLSSETSDASNLLPSFGIVPLLSACFHSITSQSTDCGHVQLDIYISGVFTDVRVLDHNNVVCTWANLLKEPIDGVSARASGADWPMYSDGRCAQTAYYVKEKTFGDSNECDSILDKATVVALPGIEDTELIINGKSAEWKRNGLQQELLNVLDSPIRYNGQYSSYYEELTPRFAVQINDCHFIYTCEGGACLRESRDSDKLFKYETFCAKYSRKNDLPATHEPTFCAADENNSEAKAMCATQCGCWDRVDECCPSSGTTCVGPQTCVASSSDCFLQECELECGFVGDCSDPKPASDSNSKCSCDYYPADENCPQSAESSHLQSFTNQFWMLLMIVYMLY